MARALAASPKERAENVMIADLLRNDLGRVAELGSVRAAPLCEPERYRTVWQLTSTVEALLPERGLDALFAATFPCGSVTGAPKVAAMRLIAGEERSPRGAYCGAVGRGGSRGGLRLQRGHPDGGGGAAGGAARYGAGGGITFASSPAGEWDELLAKAAVLDLAPGRPDPARDHAARGRTGGAARPPPRPAGQGSARYHGTPLDLAAVRALVERERGDGAAAAAPRPRRLRPAGAGATPGAARRAGHGWRSSPAPIAAGDPARYHKTAERGFYESRRAARPDCFDVAAGERGGGAHREHHRQPGGRAGRGEGDPPAGGRAPAGSDAGRAAGDRAGARAPPDPGRAAGGPPDSGWSTRCVAGWRSGWSSATPGAGH